MHLWTENYTTKTLQILRMEGSGMICLMEIKTAKAIQFLRREGSYMICGKWRVSWHETPLPTITEIKKDLKNNKKHKKM